MSYPNPIRQRVMPAVERALLLRLSPEFKAGGMQAFAKGGAASGGAVAENKQSNFRVPGEKKGGGAGVGDAKKDGGALKDGALDKKQSKGRSSIKSTNSSAEKEDDERSKALEDQIASQVKEHLRKKKLGEELAANAFWYRGGGGNLLGQVVPLSKEELDFTYSNWQNEVRERWREWVLFCCIV